MTDNGAAYIAAVWALACRAHGVRHLRIRPRRPRTNGKAERFIRTLLGGWAMGLGYTLVTAVAMWQMWPRKRGGTA